MGFEEPTKIQKEAIPHLLEGYRDFIGLAQTGTGKTAAFGLPLLQLIEPTDNSVQALILAPTRELCQQITEQIELFSKFSSKIGIVSVYGGASIGPQIKALKKPTQVVVATPGRLIDLAKRKAIKLNEIDYLVLDEADEMLNMGFKEELDEILAFTPPDKVTWLFSATMPQSIQKMVQTYMIKPIEVKIDVSDKVNANIEHQYVMVNRSDKLEALTRFLDIDPHIRGVVFCRTRMDTQNLAEDLMKKKYLADAIHGDLSQAQRDRVMQRFKNNELQLLIATDVAARGIDVNDLTHVFHHTPPDDVSWYTHRSGRTARAGKKGISLAFVEQRDLGRMRGIAKELGIQLTKVSIPNYDEVGFSRIDAWARDVLSKKTKGKIDPEILKHVGMLMGNLTKEELLAKVIRYEMDKMSTSTGGDLNKVEEKPTYVKRRPRGGGGGSRKSKPGRGRATSGRPPKAKGKPFKGRKPGKAKKKR
jgi:ATP-dependent RNA helicase DeaD